MPSVGQHCQSVKSGIHTIGCGEEDDQIEGDGDQPVVHRWSLLVTVGHTRRCELTIDAFTQRLDQIISKLKSISFDLMFRLKEVFKT